MRIGHLCLSIFVLSLFPTSASAGSCDSDLTCQFLLCRSPASSVPAELWGDLQPVDIGQLPENRDNTDFDEFDTGYSSNEPLWMAIDVEGDYLYAGLHLGLQVWQRTAGGANLNRLDVLDGSGFAFWNNPVQAHEFFPLRDIDASAGAGNPPNTGTAVVAMALVNNIGLSVLNVDIPSDPKPIYGDKDKQGNQVYVTDIGGRTYAFMATGGQGLLAYDLTAVEDRTTPCVDSSPGSTPCGAYIGRLGTTSSFSYVDGVGDFVVASGGGLSFGMQIWDVSTPSSPQLVLDHTSDFFQGVALWEDGGNIYLGAQLITLPSGDLFARIYNVSCIQTDSCTSLGGSLWSRALPSSSGAYATYSESGGVGYLFLGNNSRCNQGLQAEWLYDVSNPSNPNDITPPAATVNGVLTGYWGHYYRRNPSGFNGTSARMGQFAGEYFYRAALSILDIHRLSAPQAPTVGTVTASPNPALVCQDVSFDLTSVAGNPVPTLSWELRDGAGALVTTAGNVDPFVWSVPSSTPPDTYTAAVTATNAQGSAMASSPAVTVNALPALSFDGGPTNDPFNGPTVQFHISSEGATEWNWDFGDGTTTGWISDPVDGPNPSHTYAAIGDYDVTVSIRNCVEGPLESSPLTVMIVNTAPLSIEMFEADSPVCGAFGCFAEVGQEITFTTTVTGSPTLYQYDWDGDMTFDQASASPILQHTYSTTGFFTPTLQVTRPGETVSLDHTPGSISVSAATGSLPAAPSGVGATAVSSSEVQVTWTDNAVNETGFDIEVTRDGLLVSTFSVGAGSTSALATGLDAETDYSFRVRAFNGDGNSAFAGPAFVTTPVDGALVFSDGFEAGNTLAWDLTVP